MRAADIDNHRLDSHNAVPSQGEEEDKGSYEYLVYQSVLVDIGRRFDLHPVLDYPELDDILEPAEQRKVGKALFRRFLPNIVGLHPSLQLASRVNCAFVFRKGMPDAAHGGKRKREEGEEQQQSDGALRAAAVARLSASQGNSTAGGPAMVRNGGGVPGTQQGGARNSVDQGSPPGNPATTLADEDELLLVGGAAGRQANNAEQQQPGKPKQSAYKRSSKFQRAR